MAWLGAERFAYKLTERLSLNEKYDFHVFANRWRSDSDRITFHKAESPSFVTGRHHGEFHLSQEHRLRK